MPINSDSSNSQPQGSTSIDIMEKAVVFVKAIDSTGTIIYANEAELSFLKFTKEQYLGQNICDLFLEEADCKGLITSLLKGNMIDNREVQLRAATGQIKHVLVSTMFTDDFALKPAFYIFSRDITHFKRTQELLGYLNKAGEELATALDTETALTKVSDLIVPKFADWLTIDVLKNGIIEQLKITHQDPEKVKWGSEYRKNNAPEQQENSSLVQVIESGHALLVPLVTPEMIKATIKEPERLKLMLNLGLQSVIIVPICVKDKSTGAVTFISTTPGRNYDETDQQFAQDFANRVGLTLDNARLFESANKEIEQRIQAEKRKDEFISIASHELKTPLTSIKAYVQLLQRITRHDEKVYSLVNKTTDHIARLERLISDLLDVSKIEAGKIIYAMEDFDFHATLQETIESVQHTSPQHQIIIEQSDKVTVNGDRQRIEQVINNFITNAIKYSPEADKVIVKSIVESNNLIVSIQDFGIGIESENLSNLFNRFYRVDNTAMRFQGLGLGLYISAEILKRHNGSFWIESSPEQGSTFYFLLPLKEKSFTFKTDKQTYYTNELITIQLEAVNKWLYVDWTGFQTFDSVKHGCLMIHDLLQKTGVSKVLNDNTHVEGNWSEAVDWVAEVFFPMMEAAGCKYFAWVFSNSTFSQLSAQKSVDIMQGNIITQIFNSKQEAEQWLSEMD